MLFEGVTMTRAAVHRWNPSLRKMAVRVLDIAHLLRWPRAHTPLHPCRTAPDPTRYSRSQSILTGCALLGAVVAVDMSKTALPHRSAAPRHSTASPLVHHRVGDRENHLEYAFVSQHRHDSGLIFGNRFIRTRCCNARFFCPTGRHSVGDAERHNRLAYLAHCKQNDSRRHDYDRFGER